MSVNVASSFNPEIPSIHGTNMLGTLQARDNELFTTGDDSDDDLPVITKKKKAILRLTDSDDDDDEGNQPKAPAEKDNNKSESDSEDQDRSEGVGKGKKRIAKLFDDSDDEDTGTESKTEVETEEHNDEAAEKGRKKIPRLFDSDGEDELTEGHCKDESDDETGDARDGEEEEEGDKEMSDALKKRLAKGAAKKTKNSQKKEKEEVRQIHSETQRIIRESAVRIPYHMPKPKSLSEFLARTKEKQAKIKEFSTRLALNKHKDPITLTASSQQKTSPDRKKGNISGQKQKSPIDSKAQMASSEETPPDSKAQMAGGLKIVESEEGENKTLTNSQELDLGENELPDLGNVGNKVENKINQENTAELEMNDVSCKNQEQMDSINDADVSGPLSDVTNKVNTTDTDLRPTVNDGVQGSETSEIRDKNQDTDTAAEKDSTKKSLKEKLAEKLKTVTPKLSGGPEDMIDLEGDSGIASGQSMAPGMKDLMNRLVLHSARRKKKKARDVEISVVKKDQVSENREELKLEKVTVHLDEEQEEEPKNLPPGGRWNKIKEKLSTEMRAKREESRQRRQEVYDLDNEEGFQARMEEEKEEEAELTDQTDTDVSDEEGDEWDEDVYLEEEEDDEGMLEDKPRKKSAFVDGEAEEDGDDEEEEDAREQEDEMMGEGEIEDEDLKLHLAGSDCEDDGSVGMDTASERVSPTESLEVPISSGMKKASSIHLDVLDEDAISQSPLSSAPDAAKQDCESDVVGDRPFQQLSQGKEVEKSVLEQLSQGKEAEKSMLQKDLSDQNTTMTDFLSERDGSLLSADNSFDLMGSLIPAGQGHRKSHRDTPEIFSPTSKQSTGTEGTSTSCSTKRLCDITLPIEDSQLFMTNPPKGDTMSTDTESNWLDEEGFLKPAKRELCLGGTESSTQENMDELLGLCSGKFTGDGTETQKSDEAASFGFASQLKNTQSQMDELLGLCSGQFTESTQKESSGADSVKPFRTQTKSFSGFPGLHSTSTQSSSNTQSNMDELLGLCSGTFRTSSPAPEDSPAKPSQMGRRKKRKAVMISDDEDDVMLGDEADTGKRIDQALGEQDESENDDQDMEDEDEQELDPEEAEQIQKFTGFKTKKGKLRREFVDEEAELSGSEYDSDENLDIAAKDDVMEEEEGDKVDLGMTEEELRDQVGKVHLKSLIDEDKRKLLLYQEMYLPDGDLHSEGGGRSRRFRWKNIDEDTQGDMFANGSDDEQNEEENENETKWRLERYEREKFLQEQKAKEEAEETESQLLKLGKSVFKPQRSLKKSVPPKPSTKPQESHSAESETNTSMRAPKTTPRQSSTTASPASLKRRGSLLCRSKDSLDRIAMLSKPVTNPNGARHSRNFVFAALSPDAKPKPEMKRSTSKMEPPAKKPKVERSSSLPAGSIFKLM